ncbi:PAS domain-containing protein [Rhodothermus sp. AH-315-K08]|nr:PAS domain-containing protein [Rhodothermus sp. AH-315-K08]
MIRFGYTVEDRKQGKFHFPNFVHADDRDRVMAEVERVFGAGGDRIELEYRLVTSDYQIRYIIDRTTGLYDENGEIQYWQGVLTDITESGRPKSN